MKVLVTGSKGLIGSALIPFLIDKGCEVVRLVRTERVNSEKEFFWDPESGKLDPFAFNDCDAVIHLAGENIAASRWTRERKSRIRMSRVNGTRLLTETLASLDDPPKVFVSSSATGYYGSRSDEKLSEGSCAGSGFLPEVCLEWEGATSPLVNTGIRLVILRIGIVLSSHGGALAKMLTPFSLGLGGKIGSGSQYWSWIAIDDLVEVIHFVMVLEGLRGIVNAVAPEPIRNTEFTKILGSVLSRPAFLPLPAFVAKILLGEMAEELLLASTRVEPHQLQEAGFAFRCSHLEEALRCVLDR